jgi:hypothetical protein
MSGHYCTIVMSSFTCVFFPQLKVGRHTLHVFSDFSKNQYFMYFSPENAVLVLKFTLSSSDFYRLKPISKGKCDESLCYIKIVVSL